MAGVRQQAHRGHVGPGRRTGSGSGPGGGPAPAASAPTGGGSYVVHTGETLNQIAAAHGVAGGWQALFRINGSRISNPNLIFAGQRLLLG